MSIEAGQRYKITNAKGGTALDLSSDDEHTIAGWDWHGGDNQIVHSFPPLRPGIFSNISDLFSGKPLPTAESGISGAPRAASTLPSRREIPVMASASLPRTNRSVGTSGPTHKMRAFTGMLSGTVRLVWCPHLLPPHRICLPDTVFNIDLTNYGDSAGGTAVEIWGRWEAQNQCWRFEQGTSLRFGRRMLRS